MKIVMTGGSGLVGNALGKKLVGDGHELRVLARGPGHAKLSFPCTIFAWDGEKEAAPAAAFAGVEAVIHLAGENIAGARWSSERKKHLRDSRVVSAQNLKRGMAAARVTPRVVVSASGVGYYGDRGDEALPESAGAGHDFLAKLCVDWEAAALDLGAERTVLARFGVVLSAQGGFLRQVAPLFTVFGASALGSGQQWFSWIHIDDLANLLALAVTDARLTGALNAVAPTPVTNAELTRALAHQLKTFRSPPVPTLALKLLYGELTEAMVGSQRAIPDQLRAQGFVWKYPTVERALSEIYGDIQVGEMKVVYETWIDAAPEEVWPFFSSEKNLERLTPPFLNFHVTGKSTEHMQAGTLIDYQLKLRGLPLNWRTRIVEWKEKTSFVDEQLKGPYQKWHHRHEFTSFAGGTRMRDTVHFKVPFGWVGRLASLLIVMKEVETIFTYRNQIIGELYARSPYSSPH